MAAEERWERIATGTMWTGILLAGLAGYGLIDGEDFWGVVMTLAPAALCFAMWWLARARHDALVAGRPMGPIGWAVSGGLALVGTVCVIAGVTGRPPHPQHAAASRAIDPVEFARTALDDSTVVTEIHTRVGPGSGTMTKVRSLAHIPASRLDPNQTCSEWREERLASDSARTLRFCADGL